jgi:hypothetical protein
MAPWMVTFLATLAFAEASGKSTEHKKLLVFRFYTINGVAFALLGAVWFQGWVSIALEADVTRLVEAIAVVFAYGLWRCGCKVHKTSEAIDQVVGIAPQSMEVCAQLTVLANPDGHSRTLAASALELKLGSRISSVRYIARVLVQLGLIGTVVGFIIAFSGVDSSTAINVESIGPMVSALISGMSIALYTTLVGSILSVWLMVNYLLLESGVVTLLNRYIESGEAARQRSV